MKAAESFTKISDQLVAIGLPLRLAMLYGKLAFHAKNGKCCPRHATLAEEIGVKRRQLIYLLEKLEQLKLIEWTRKRYGNCYRVFAPDVQSIAHLMSHPDVQSTAPEMCTPLHISGPIKSLGSFEKNIEKKENRPPKYPVREYGNQNGKPAAAATQPKKWEAFTALYPPAKLNHAKAKIEWSDLTATQQSAAIAWLEHNRSCPQWLADNGQYIPLASNFLKRREFEAPPPPVIQRKGPQSFVEREREKFELTVAMAEQYSKLGGKKP